MAHRKWCAPQNLTFLWRMSWEVRHRNVRFCGAPHPRCATELWSRHLHVGQPRAAPFLPKFPNSRAHPGLDDVHAPRPRRCTPRRRQPDATASTPASTPAPTPPPRHRQPDATTSTPPPRRRHRRHHLDTGLDDVPCAGISSLLPPLSPCHLPPPSPLHRTMHSRCLWKCLCVYLQIFEYNKAPK